MTPEIKELDEQISKLREKRDALMQAYLSTVAIAQVGEKITWGRGRVGRVLSLGLWCGEVSYVVRSMFKSGGEGAVATVRPYDDPKLSA